MQQQHNKPMQKNRKLEELRQQVQQEEELTSAKANIENKIRTLESQMQQDSSQAKTERQERATPKKKPKLT